MYFDCFKPECNQPMSSVLKWSYAQRWEMDWQDKQFMKEEAHSIRICLSLKTTHWLSQSSVLSSDRYTTTTILLILILLQEKDVGGNQRQSNYRWWWHRTQDESKHLYYQNLPSLYKLVAILHCHASSFQLKHLVCRTSPRLIIQCLKKMFFQDRHLKYKSNIF